MSEKSAEPLLSPEDEALLRRGALLMDSHYIRKDGSELYVSIEEIWALLDAARLSQESGARAAGWRPIETAPKDRLILFYAPPREGLSAIQGAVQWHPDAGFCVDELRVATHWRECLPPPTPSPVAGEGERKGLWRIRVEMNDYCDPPEPCWWIERQDGTAFARGLTEADAQEVVDTRADMLRLHDEKVDMLERALAAEQRATEAEQRVAKLREAVSDAAHSGKVIAAWNDKSGDKHADVPLARSAYDGLSAALKETGDAFTATAQEE